MTHVKTINGKKYYYKSMRVGDKITSKYVGPVQRVRKQKTKEEKKEEQEQDYIG